jgi:hypothetical protein
VHPFLCEEVLSLAEVEGVKSRGVACPWVTHRETLDHYKPHVNRP